MIVSDITDYFPRFSVGQESTRGAEDIIDRLRSMVRYRGISSSLSDRVCMMNCWLIFAELRCGL